MSDVGCFQALKYNELIDAINNHSPDREMHAVWYGRRRWTVNMREWATGLTKRAKGKSAKHQASVAHVAECLRLALTDLARMHQADVDRLLMAYRKRRRNRAR